MKSTININLGDIVPCALHYKYYPGDNDWDLTGGCYIDSGISMCRATLDLFSERFRSEINTAIHQDILRMKKAA